MSNKFCKNLNQFKFALHSMLNTSHVIEMTHIIHISNISNAIFLLRPIQLTNEIKSTFTLLFTLALDL